MIAFAALNVALVVAAFTLSWLPVVTLLVDRPVTTAMLRVWLPAALALATVVAIFVLPRISPGRRRAFFVRHVGIFLVVPLIYVVLRLDPGVHRTELGLLYLWTAAYFALHMALAAWHELPRWTDRIAGLSLAATALAVYLIVSPYHQASMTANADEPHYLIVSQSILSDRDLDLRNNYDERHYRPYHPAPLRDRHVIEVGTAQYPIRDVGLPLVAAVPFALAGRLGVLVLQALLAALLVWQLFHLLRDVGIARAPAWLAVALIALTHPLLTYTTQVYPDIAAALVIVLALRLLASRTSDAPARLAMVSGLLGLLPWLTIRTWPSIAGVGVVLAYVAVTGSRSSPGRAPARWVRALAAILPGAALVAANMAYHWWAFGLPLPNAGYLLIREQHDVAGNVLVGIAGMFLGRTYGLLSHAPFYLLVALGSWALVRRVRVAGPAGVAILAAGALHVLFIASVVQWHGDWSPPSRNVLLALPLLAAAAAAGLEVAARMPLRPALRTALIGASVAWTAAVTLLLLSFPENLYNLPQAIRSSRSSGRLWDFVAERVGIDPGLAFPSIARIDDATLLVSGLWLAAIAGLAVLGATAQGKVAVIRRAS